MTQDQQPKSPLDRLTNLRSKQITFLQQYFPNASAESLHEIFGSIPDIKQEQFEAELEQPLFEIRQLAESIKQIKIDEPSEKALTSARRSIAQKSRQPKQPDLVEPMVKVLNAVKKVDFRQEFMKVRQHFSETPTQLKPTAWWAPAVVGALSKLSEKPPSEPATAENASNPLIDLLNSKSAKDFYQELPILLQQVNERPTIDSENDPWLSSTLIRALQSLLDSPPAPEPSTAVTTNPPQNKSFMDMLINGE